jgi:aminoglycoside phosphotransferase (APT) family kinase protein
LRGRPLIELPVPERTPYAPALAEFLAALHRPAPTDAPHNPVRGVPLADRAELAAEHFATGLIPEADRLSDLWSRILETPAWQGDPVWVHGDPHPANVLVDHDQLAAMIDFGDINAGDPATDLAAAWMSFDAAGRRAFQDHYRSRTTLDPDTWDRARGWALAIGMALVVNSDDHPQLAAVGRHALSAVLAD